MAHKIKNGMLVFIFIVLLLPLAQQELRIFPVAASYGSHQQQLYREFYWPGWWDGTFWETRNTYLNDAVGFRGELIEINNQIDYSLFNKYKSQSLVIGENHCLFWKEFIFPYCGIGLVSKSIINEKLRKLKAIQDTLARLGKTFIFIQAPCKASYYPEYLPKEFKKMKTGVNNYDIYTRAADSMGINHIDFNAWFMAMKGKSKDLLFTKQGIHWSMYGSLIAADSLVNYVERVKHIRMPRPVWRQVVHTGKARYMDDDITKSMKIIFPVTHETYSYPDVTYPVDGSMTTPRVVYIGDSYVYNWVYSRFPDNANIHWEFWHYFKDIWDRYSEDEAQIHKPIAGYDWVQSLNNSDLVIMMYTSANLPHLGDGFIEKAYEHYYPAITKPAPANPL
jgi:hypothetical protein